ncbi:5-methylcytosine-specific restriction endonuclease McrBC regulatory subunit McrC [Variovorax sp. 1133]
MDENRLVKSALQRVLDYFGSCRPADLNRIKLIRDCLFLFDTVELPAKPFRFSEAQLASMVQRLPRHHREYAELLWIAFLLNSKRGFAIESLGAAVFNTLVVNLADVFEDYVRSLVAQSIEKFMPSAQVLNGNQRQVPLFTHGSDFVVKPDIYLRKDGRFIAALDAKYKPRTKAADRYEVLAFCEALQVKKAVLICPSAGVVHPELIGITPGRIELHQVKIDLSCADMSQAEDLFIASLKQVMTTD